MPFLITALLLLQSAPPPSGQVNLDCLVQPDRTLADCRPFSEQAEKLGLAQRALDAVKTFKVPPPPEGPAAGQRISVGVKITAPSKLPATDDPNLIVKPEWDRRPSRSELFDVFPERAQRLEREGSVSLLCTVKAGGALSDCMVEAEDPLDFNFGAAALALAPSYKMKPKLSDGTETAGRKVRVIVTFSFA